MIKCPKCNKECANNRSLSHLQKVHNLSFESSYEIKISQLVSNEAVCEIIKNYNNGESINSIKDNFNLVRKDVEFILKSNGVELRGVSESLKTSVIRDRVIKTNISKYGVGNVSQSDSVKEKKKKTFLKNYGVDNIFKNLDFIDSLNDIMLDNYGQKRLTNGAKQSETKKGFSDDKWKSIYDKWIESVDLDKMSERAKKQWRDISEKDMIDLSKKISKSAKLRWEKMPDDIKNEKLKHLHNITKSSLEFRVEKILFDLCIDFEPQFNIKNRFYDFLILDSNIIIEVQGDFWHANPNKYNKDDILPFPNNSVKACDLWDKDLKKKDLATKNGYLTLYIWEDDMKKMSDNDLKLCLIEKIANYDEKKDY
mgnify:CR=1 FL=1